MHVEEGFELSREFRATRQGPDDRGGALTSHDRRRDGLRASSSGGERVEIALEALQRRGLALGYPERRGPVPADDLLVLLSELLHHGVGRAGDDEMDRPDAIHAAPYLEPRFGGIRSRHHLDGNRADPGVMPEDLGEELVVPLAPERSSQRAPHRR